MFANGSKCFNWMIPKERQRCMVEVNFPGIVNRSPNRTESNFRTIESVNRISVLLTTPFWLDCASKPATRYADT